VAESMAAAARKVDLPPGRLLHMYRQMLRIRKFEEEVDRLYQAGKIWGTFHLYIGQEASAVGAIEALSPGTTSPAPTGGTATPSPRARPSP